MIFGHARWGVLAAVLTALVFSHSGARSLYPLPFPHFDRLIVSPRYGLEDISIIVAGFRRLAADIAWIQLLLYTGGGIFPEENPDRSYDKLKDFTLRVTRIDPHFLRAYMFGSGILAWFRSVNRPQEALEVLREGIRYNPQHWPLRAHMAAILYKAKDKPESMLIQLEEAASQADCPLIVKAILANLYKSRGEHLKAIAIWQKVLATESDSGAQERAKSQIRILRQLAAPARKRSRY